MKIITLLCKMLNETCEVCFSITCKKLILHMDFFCELGLNVMDMWGRKVYNYHVSFEVNCILSVGRCFFFYWRLGVAQQSLGYYLKYGKIKKEWAGKIKHNPVKDRDERDETSTRPNTNTGACSVTSACLTLASLWALLFTITRCYVKRLTFYRKFILSTIYQLSRNSG